MAVRWCGCRRDRSTRCFPDGLRALRRRVRGFPRPALPHRLGAQPVLGSSRHRQFRREHLFRAGTRAAAVLYRRRASTADVAARQIREALGLGPELRRRRLPDVAGRTGALSTMRTTRTITAPTAPASRTWATARNRPAASWPPAWTSRSRAATTTCERSSTSATMCSARCNGNGWRFSNSVPTSTTTSPRVASQSAMTRPARTVGAQTCPGRVRPECRADDRRASVAVDPRTGARGPSTRPGGGQPGADRPLVAGGARRQAGRATARLVFLHRVGQRQSPHRRRTLASAGHQAIVARRLRGGRSGTGRLPRHGGRLLRAGQGLSSGPGPRCRHLAARSA